LGGTARISGMLPKSEQYFAEAFPDVPRK